MAPVTHIPWIVAGRDLRRGPGARAMGNSVSRPSCLGEKSRRPEELLREPGLDAGQPSAGGDSEAWPGLLEKAPVPVENGWSPVPGAIRSRPGSPVLRRSQSEVAVQNGGAAGVAVRGQVGGAAWTPPRASVPRSTWSWKPVTTREVTEVTEVTETIVTEIVEVTEYPAGEKGGEPVVTRTVTVLTECVGELTAAGCAGHTDATEVTDRQRPLLGGHCAKPCATGLPSGVVFSTASLDLPVPWPGLLWSHCLCPGGGWASGTPRAGCPAWCCRTGSSLPSASPGGGHGSGGIQTAQGVQPLLWGAL